MTVELDRESELLRIFLGDRDAYRGKPLYEALVLEAKRFGIAGATVISGILAFGASSRIHEAHLFDLSSDLPVIVEIVDRRSKLLEFMEIANSMIEESGNGALVTIEKADVIRYKPKIGYSDA